MANLGMQAIGFTLQLEDTLTPKLAKAAKAYEQFVSQIEVWNRRAYDAASKGMEQMAGAVSRRPRRGQRSVAAAEDVAKAVSANASKTEHVAEVAEKLAKTLEAISGASFSKVQELGKYLAEAYDLTGRTEDLSKVLDLEKKINKEMDKLTKSQRKMLRPDVLVITKSLKESVLHTKNLNKGFVETEKSARGIASRIESILEKSLGAERLQVLRNAVSDLSEGFGKIGSAVGLRSAKETAVNVTRDMNDLQRVLQLDAKSADELSSSLYGMMKGMKNSRVQITDMTTAMYNMLDKGLDKDKANELVKVMAVIQSNAPEAGAAMSEMAADMVNGVGMTTKSVEGVAAQMMQISKVAGISIGKTSESVKGFVEDNLTYLQNLKDPKLKEQVIGNFAKISAALTKAGGDKLAEPFTKAISTAMHDVNSDAAIQLGVIFGRNWKDVQKDLESGNMSVISDLVKNIKGMEQPQVSAIESALGMGKGTLSRLVSKSGEAEKALLSLKGVTVDTAGGFDELDKSQAATQTTTDYLIGKLKQLVTSNKELNEVLYTLNQTGIIPMAGGLAQLLGGLAQIGVLFPSVFSAAATAVTTAFRAIAVGARSLMLALGPVGLILLGLGAAAEVLNIAGVFDSPKIDTTITPTVSAESSLVPVSDIRSATSAPSVNVNQEEVVGSINGLKPLLEELIRVSSVKANYHARTVVPPMDNTVSNSVKEIAGVLDKWLS